jgi:hypothetical protein
MISGSSEFGNSWLHGRPFYALWRFDDDRRFYFLGDDNRTAIDPLGPRTEVHEAARFNFVG